MCPGHRDISERELCHPLVSISFGQRGVYLSGGESVNDVPMAMWLRCGDVLIMSGAQRLVYHGMPLIVVDEENHYSDIGDEQLEDTRDYLLSHRLNISVRQVHAKFSE
jgi:alkylated DNA repair dioxygenase AlkB